MTTLRTLMAALALALAAVAAQADAPRTLTAADLWAVERVGAPEVSPDGRWAVFPLTKFDVAANRGTTNLMLMDLRAGTLRQFTRHDGSDGSPAWSPDSRRIAFVSRRGDGPAQLYVMPVDGGEPRKVTDLPVGVAAPQWFPDGERIAVWLQVTPGFDGDFGALAGTLRERRASRVTARVTENRVYRFWDRWLTDGDTQRLFAIEVRGGTATDLMPGSDIMRAVQGNPSYRIAPDGSEIAISMNSAPPPYPSANSDIFLLTPDGSGTMRNITADNPASDSGPVYSRDGRYIYYGRQARTDFYADNTRIVRYDRRTGQHLVLTGEVDLSFSNWSVSENGRMLYALAQHDGAVSIFSLPAAGGRVNEVHRGGGIAGLRLGPGDTLLFTRSSFTQPAELFSVSRNGARARQLTTMNAEALDGVRFGQVESVTYPGADGAQVQMWVVYPPDFDPSRKWPLLVQIHGGPHGIVGDDFSFRWNPQAFAAPGYVVIAPNFHGSTSFGQAFTESIHGNHADLPYRDVMKAVDFMLERGYIDESRMAAAGGSYGGYLVSWIAGRTDRFAALINHAGVYNLMAQFASDVTLHREAAYGGSPWDGREAVERWSPATQAENFVTPMLVIHGERDYRVPVTQGLEVYGVYQGKGVPARLVYYPDENHWILNPQNSIHWYGEFHGWLERWLGMGPTPP